MQSKATEYHCNQNIAFYMIQLAYFSVLILKHVQRKISLLLKNAIPI